MIERDRAGGHFLGQLIEASHTLAPDELPAAVNRVAAGLGVRGAVIHLVDQGQLRLLPLPGEGVPSRSPRDIEGTLAGRSFQNTEVLAGKDEVWVPLLDGTERLGVLELVGHLPDAEDDPRLRHLAGLVSLLVVSKTQYGDFLVQSRRLEPMDLAAEMRWSLIPPITVRTARVGVAGMLEPAYEIAGDAFDYAINGDEVHVLILDAMGHGLEASRMANLAVGAYRHSRRRGLDLFASFRAMDEVIAEQFGPERFVTAQMATLDLRSGYLRWLNAGHPRPLLVRGPSLVGELSCDPCLPIGLGDVATVSAETQLEPGDRVLFFTDGVVEGKGGNDEAFGTERLGDLFERAAIAGQQPAETMRRLSHAVLEHQANRLGDDATLLMVEWFGPE